MVHWIFGKAHAGKTTEALRLSNQLNAVMIDSDAIRDVFPLGLSDTDRINNVVRLAELAKVISDQGFDVVVAAITPTLALRTAVRHILDDVQFTYVLGGEVWENVTFDIPNNKEIIYNTVTRWQNPKTIKN